MVLATRTPPREENNENLRPPRDKLDDMDEEWATEHAKQVIPFSPVWFGLSLLTDSMRALYPQITRLGFQSTYS